jgi:hypothetical protein
VTASNRIVARCREARANGSGWPSALRGAPLGPRGRRVSYSRRSVAFGTAGVGWNGAGRGVNPGSVGVAEVPAAVISELGKWEHYWTFRTAAGRAIACRGLSLCESTPDPCDLMLATFRNVSYVQSNIFRFVMT